MKKKSLIAIGMAFCMTAGMTCTAFAAVAGDGAGALNPVGDGSSEQESTGKAYMTSSDGTTFNTENDDDSDAKADDVGGADINVWAKVVDKGTKVYKVDLAWGAMKFEYNSGSGQWNTATHTYDNTGSGAAIWTASYIDGTNNKLAVTNHSNNAIDAGLAYAMSNATAFNDTTTADDSVIGYFYADNDTALAGSQKLTNTFASGAAVANANAIAKLQLPTADEYTPKDGSTNGTLQTAGARTTNTYFAFSGKPDEGRGTTLDTFKKVGVITVTVAPSDYLPKNDTEAGKFN